MKGMTLPNPSPKTAYKRPTRVAAPVRFKACRHFHNPTLESGIMAVWVTFSIGNESIVRAFMAFVV
jgi:hypothetical protein